MINDHFQRLAELLELEADAEARRILEESRRLPPYEAEKTGNTLVDLVIQDEYAGLGGRVVVAFVKREHSPLPWTRLGPGTPVLASQPGARNANGWRGVVCEREGNVLRVAGIGGALPLAAEARA